MEFVDKSTHKEHAHRLLDNFLNRCLKMSPYPTDLYEALKADIDPDSTLNPAKKSTYKLLLEWILEDSHTSKDKIPTNEGHCCYCMRRIRSDEAHSTLEHIIPKSISELNVYNQYFNINSKLEHNQKVMALKDTFINLYRKQSPPYPHNAAYENLVASCDGNLPMGSNNHICCNTHRSDHYIPPLMMIENIHNQIQYKRSGMVIWNNNPDIDKRERFKVINEELNLNNEILRAVRMIWSYLSDNNLDCNLSEEQRRKVLDTLKQDCSLSITKDMLNNFWQDNYWNLLNEYTYFNDTTKFV